MSVTIVRIGRAVRPPGIDPEQADEIGESMFMELSSGNCCIVTPMMKRIENGECRILFFFVWYKSLYTPEELAVVTEKINKMMDGQKPEFLVESVKPENASREIDAWLGEGKHPKTVVN